MIGRIAHRIRWRRQAAHARRVRGPDCGTCHEHHTTLHDLELDAQAADRTNRPGHAAHYLRTAEIVRVSLWEHRVLDHGHTMDNP